MKVAIGSHIIEGPWGGGNLFSLNLKNYLKEQEISVCHNLASNEIDIILLTEPRIESSTSSITLFESLMYKKFVNKNVKIVHRINECDERKNTNYVNKKMLSISKNVDFTIFVSNWIYELYNNQGFSKENYKVILSGSDSKIFNNTDKNIWNGSRKLRIVTHHWGNNWNKGFEIYSLLDNLLQDEQFSQKFQFTYIGNTPKNFTFNNSKLIQPISGSKLATELKQHDLYITGSLNEPSGNHQIEASLCGLPVLYINSGGIPEYQEEYGTEFNIDNIEEVLENVYGNYSFYYKKNKPFPFEAELMSRDYLTIFKSIYKTRKSKKVSIYLYFYKFLNAIKFLKIIKIISAKIIYHLRKVVK